MDYKLQPIYRPDVKAGQFPPPHQKISCHFTWGKCELNLVTKFSSHFSSVLKIAQHDEPFIERKHFQRLILCLTFHCEYLSRKENYCVK